MREDDDGSLVDDVIEHRRRIAALSRLRRSAAVDERRMLPAPLFVIDGVAESVELLDVEVNSMLKSCEQPAADAATVAGGRTAAAGQRTAAAGRRHALASADAARTVAVASAARTVAAVVGTQALPTAGRRTALTTAAAALRRLLA